MTMRVVREVLVVLLLISASLFLYSSGAQAQQTLASGQWSEVKFLGFKGGTQFYGDDAIQVCKEAYDVGPAPIFYKGYLFDKLIDNENEGLIYAFCSSPCPTCAADPSSPIYDVCATYELIGGVKTLKTYRYGMESCQKPCDMCAVRVGNPVEVASFTKVTAAIDWISPIDSRFRIERNYRSDVTSLARFGSLYTSQKHEFGKIWQRTYNDFWFWASNPYDPADAGSWNLMELGSGARVLFLLQYVGNDRIVLDTIGGERYDARSLYVGEQPVADPSGVVRYFWAGGLMTRVVWPDGYAIFNDYDIGPDIFVKGFSDNRGNKASFVFDMNVVPG
jgi:hypothetical protein